MRGLESVILAVVICIRVEMMCYEDRWGRGVESGSCDVEEMQAMQVRLKELGGLWGDTRNRE